ncbi:MAG: MBOAT family protein, partial [Bryobacterales bacterium]|nr:MBOAT family protein [Bryobacterales bacterium]
MFLILWGLFKKRVIADTAALYCNKAFSIADSTFPIVWAGVICFSVQIYADFSAYTDIARGSARLLGFELRQNFNHPWLAQSPGDFWRRWHMSLSAWFRDYVYVPLGGSRTTEGRICRNLMITFLLSGLWHGASWNFVIWGGWWGAALVLWRILDRTLPAFTQGKGLFVTACRWGVTMILVHIGWLMFREQNFSELLRQMFSPPTGATADDWRIAGVFVALMALLSLPLWIHAAVQPRLLDHWDKWRDRPAGFALQTGIGFALAIGWL